MIVIDLQKFLLLAFFVVKARKQIAVRGWRVGQVSAQ